MAANAAEAPGHLDFDDYLQTRVAKIDLEKLNSYFNRNSSSYKARLLEELTQLLIRIETDYKKELRSISTVGREIKRTEGILLSHRRQMGVIVVAIKNTSPPPIVYALANKVEGMLNETI